MIGRFFDYIEIKTKITSLFAFLMTLSYIFYIGKPVNWRMSAVFFASMFLFDLTTTAINNYIDTRTNHQTLAFKRSTALLIIYVLFALSTGLGLYLAYLTDLVILLIGGICFLCGVLYTYGPVPISRQPLGEVLSGFFYGFFIPFILLYINMPKGTYILYSLSWQKVTLELQLIPLLTVILLSIIPMSVTANIMLANNICDVERDITQKRYTLPYYLGRKALLLFAGIYYLIYIDIILMVLLKIISPVTLVTLSTLFVVQKNIRGFFKVQDKETTFNFAIINFIVIMSVFTLTIFIGGFI